MSNHTYKFAVGDRVTKVYGKKVAVIVSLPTASPTGWGWSSNYRCRYEDSKTTFAALESNLKLAENSESSTTNMKTLYSFTKADGTTGYGTYLATNSTNQFIIEEKGTGAILTFDKNQLEEVLPYTFSVKVNGQENHYLGNANNALQKGDLVLVAGNNSSYSIGVVVDTNTKNRSPRGKFKGRKLITEPID